MHEYQEVVTKEARYNREHFHSYHHKVVSAVQSGCTSFFQVLGLAEGPNLSCKNNNHFNGKFY